PMIRHNTISEQLHGIASESLGEHTLESGKGLWLVEDAHPAVPPVENVIDHSSFRSSGSSRHGCRLPYTSPRVNISDVPFSDRTVIPVVFGILVSAPDSSPSPVTCVPSASVLWAPLASVRPGMGA